MKGFIVLGLCLIVSGCGFYSADVVQYRQVAVVPAVSTVAVVPVYDPVSYGVYGYEGPLDVTTTSIEFY